MTLILEDLGCCSERKAQRFRVQYHGISRSHQLCSPQLFPPPPVLLHFWPDTDPKLRRSPGNTGWGPLAGRCHRSLFGARIVRGRRIHRQRRHGLLLYTQSGVGTGKPKTPGSGLDATRWYDRFASTAAAIGEVVWQRQYITVLQSVDAFPTPVPRNAPRSLFR